MNLRTNFDTRVYARLNTYRIKALVSNVPSSLDYVGLIAKARDSFRARQESWREAS